MPDTSGSSLSPDRPLLTRAEVSRILRISPYTLDDWVRKGILTPIRRRGIRRVLFHPDHIDAFARGDEGAER